MTCIDLVFITQDGKVGIEYGFDSCGIQEVEELISQNPHLAAYGAREEGGTVRH